MKRTFFFILFAAFLILISAQEATTNEETPIVSEETNVSEETSENPQTNEDVEDYVDPVVEIVEKEALIGVEEIIISENVDVSEWEDNINDEYTVGGAIGDDSGVISDIDQDANSGKGLIVPGAMIIGVLLGMLMM